MRRVHVTKKQLHGAILGFFVFAAVAIMGAKLYYRFMPGDWFIDYYYAKIDDSSVNSDVTGTLCRKIRASKPTINATRTFYLEQQSDGKFVPVGEYSFKADVEKLQDTNCQPIRILAKNHPKKAGTYKFHTEAKFMVEGYEKTISYDTNAYKITETQASLAQQIENLQKQIEQNKEEIDRLKKLIEQNPAPGPTTSTPKPNQDAQNTSPMQNLNPNEPQHPDTPDPKPPVDQGLIPDRVPIIGKLL